MSVLLAAGGAGIWRLMNSRSRREHEKVELSSAGEALEAERAVFESSLFPSDSIPLVLVVADAIVPRFGSHSGAGEPELLPRLDRCLVASPEGGEVFRRHWPGFEQEIRKRVPFSAGRPDPEKLHEALAQWHRDYAIQDDPSLPASYFEALRRNVLLAYYTSPAGWASVGYSGPANILPAELGTSVG